MLKTPMVQRCAINGLVTLAHDGDDVKYADGQISSSSLIVRHFVAVAHHVWHTAYLICKQTLREYVITRLRNKSQNSVRYSKDSKAIENEEGTNANANANANARRVESIDTRQL